MNDVSIRTLACFILFAVLECRVHHLQLVRSACVLPNLRAQPHLSLAAPLVLACPSTNELCSNEIDADRPPTTHTQFNKFFHIYSGRFAYLAGVVQCYRGLELVSSDDKLIFSAGDGLDLKVTLDLQGRGDRFRLAMCFDTQFQISSRGISGGVS